MTQEEFASIIAFLTDGCGKELEPRRLEVYYQSLRDIHYNIMQTAAVRVLCEHVWATFPSIAELRQAAAATKLGVVTELSPAEVWEMAWSAAGRIDLDIQGPYISGDKVYDSQASCVLEGLPPIVVEAMRCFGIPPLIYGAEPVGVVRGQFMKIVEQLQARDSRDALLSPAVKEAIAANRPPAELPRPPAKAIEAKPDNRPARQLAKAWDADEAMARIENLEPLPAEGDNPWRQFAAGSEGKPCSTQPW